MISNEEGGKTLRRCRRCACAARQSSIPSVKMRMGATYFLMKRLLKVATEMALHVLAYNLTRVRTSSA
jgi:hypothetical protein